MACGPLGLDRIEVAPNGALTATPMSATPATACLSLGYAEGLFFDEHAYLNHVLRGRVTPLDETPRLELRRSGGPTTTRGRSDASGVLLSHSEGVDVIEPSLLGWADGYEVVREVRQGRAALSAVGTADRLLVAWEDGRVGIPDGRSAEGLGGPRFVAGYPYDEPDEVLAIGPETAAPLRWERDEVAELPFTLPSVVGGSRGDTLQWTEDCRVVAQIVATDDGWRVRYTALRSAGAVSVDGPELSGEPPPFDAVGSPIPVAFARGGEWVVVAGDLLEALPVDEAALDEACDPRALAPDRLFGDVVAIASHDPKHRGSHRFAALTASLRAEATPPSCSFAEEGDCSAMVCPTTVVTGRPSVGPITADGVTRVVVEPGPRTAYDTVELEDRRFWQQQTSIHLSAPGDDALGFDVEVPTVSEEGGFDTYAISRVGDAVFERGVLWIQWHDVPSDEVVMVWLEDRHDTYDAVLTCAFPATRRAGRVPDALLARLYDGHSRTFLTVGHGRPVQVGDLRVTALQALIGSPGGAAYRLELTWSPEPE
ncbi:MAG: hypothetical protein KC621_26975 [Myxococcales bacterium]|nr:hypothetical protein [Myxococcales bacterium]